MKYIWLLFLLFNYGCYAPTKPVVISLALIDANRSIAIKGLDNAIIGEINRDTGSNSPWPGLYAFYRMPVDTDMKDYQNRQPGHYQVKNNVLVFTPDTPFVKGQVYFLRCYQYEANKSPWDYFKNKKKPGEMRHTDLIFKN